LLCAIFRLARYNVLSDDQVPTKIFFGFPPAQSRSRRTKIQMHCQ